MISSTAIFSLALALPKSKEAPMSAEIRSIEIVERPEELRGLVRAYLAHELRELKAVSGISLDLEDLVAKTFDQLDEYLPPRGRLHLASDADGKLIGCVFLKMIRSDAAEVKRLYVRPEARGIGLGRELMAGVLADARSLGAGHVLLDTGIYDTAAHALYGKLGFREIDYYPEGENDPTLGPYLCYMQLDFETTNPG
jgi:GNAT superfamily N-acetyltransferase